MDFEVISGGFSLAMCDFKLVSWILKSYILNSKCPFRFAQLVQTTITSLFQFQFTYYSKSLTHDFLRFKMIYSLTKIDLKKSFKIYLKVKYVHLLDLKLHFLSLTSRFGFQPSSYICLFSNSLHNLHEKIKAMLK